ncbi:MAG TPA: hypothetical protein VGM91_20825 [Conexibacter sp.]
MTGRERFEAALAGRSVAWAPLLWERLPELVRQPAAAWWRDATVAQRLLADAAGVAGADALFVLAVPGERGGGEDALDALADGADALAVRELVGRLRASAPFAAIAALPDAAALLRDFGAGDPDVAEDALADLARSLLDAGADALAVVGDQAGESARRVAAIGAFYGRPVLAVEPARAWFESGSDAPVALVGEDGGWPAAGLAVTAGDVSARWDADALRAAGEARP